jgi:hypothetical protein
MAVLRANTGSRKSATNAAFAISRSLDAAFDSARSRL